MPDAAVNGFQLHYEDEGSGDALVLLHGACSSSRRFRTQIADLARDYRMLAVDMRGMGGSARVESVPPSAWVDDLAALLAHLQLPRAHIYGVSLGARVALRLAIDHPNLVRSLCLDMPIIANDEAGDSSLRQRFNSDSGGLSPQRRQELEHLHGSDWETVFRNYSNIRQQADLQEYFNLRQPSRGVRVPTLVMRGDEENAVHPLAHAVELHENIAGSWLWIEPHTSGGLLENASQAAYARFRAFFSHVESGAVARMAH